MRELESQVWMVSGVFQCLVSQADSTCIFSSNFALVTWGRSEKNTFMVKSLSTLSKLASVFLLGLQGVEINFKVKAYDDT